MVLMNEWLATSMESHVQREGKARRNRSDLFGPGRMWSEGKRKPWSGGQKCFPLKRRPFRTGTEVLSAQAATISDRDKSAFRSSGDHSGPGQKCFPPKRRPFQTGTEMLSAQAATISDRDRSAFRSSGDHFGPGQKCFPPKRRPFQTGTEMLSAQAATISDPKSILSGTPGGLSTTDPSKTVTAHP